MLPPGVTRVIDPDYQMDKFWDHVRGEAALSEWLQRITASINQHFICRDPRCKLVIDSRHWLRQISHTETIHSQSGKYICPNCLVTHRPWAAKMNHKAPRPPSWSRHRKPWSSRLARTTPRSGSTSTRRTVVGSKWESAADDWLISKLKQIVKGTHSDNIDASNLVDYLADKIQNSGHQNQIAPYVLLGACVWSPRTTPRS